MAPAVPPKNNAVAMTARIAENDVPSSSSMRNRNFNGSSSYHDMFPQSRGGGNSRSNASNTSMSERRKVIQDLIKEGPQGGPNREKLLRSAQQLRSPSSSSSSSRRTNNQSSSRLSMNHGSTEEDVNDNDTNDTNNDNHNDINSNSMGSGGSYRGGMGMGNGMGMGGYGGGMGMGMGSMYGMGMGMGMNPMMMGMGGMMSGPMSWIYSLQAIVHSIGYAINVVGMNSHMLYHLFNQLWGIVTHSVEFVKKSTFRKW